MKKTAAITPISQPVLTGLPTEVRARLLADHGIDIAADDPLMTLVAMNQIVLPLIAAEIAKTIADANKEAMEQSAKMRQETLKATAADLGWLASQAREELRMDLARASVSADALIRSIQVSLRATKWFWICIGALMALGYTAGRQAARLFGG